MSNWVYTGWKEKLWDKFKNKASSLGHSIIDTEYKGSQHKYLIKYNCGHEHYVSQAAFMCGYNYCKICIENEKRKSGKTYKYNIKDLKIWALARDGECLSNEYKGCDFKYTWKCNKHNYIWEAEWRNIGIQEKWCSRCGDEASGNKHRKHWLSDLREMAKLYLNGECLEVTEPKQGAPLKWRCGRGHEFTRTTISSIKRGCPVCNKIISDENLRIKREGIEKRKLEKAGKKTKIQLLYEERANNRVVRIANLVSLAHKIAEERNGVLLTPDNKITSTQNKLQWKCNVCEHGWGASLNQLVYLNSWCAVCGLKKNHGINESKGEKLFRETLERIVGAKFPKAMPEWLVNPYTGYTMELDGYNEDLKLAFEYNGEPHFNVKKTFEKSSAVAQKKDDLKIQICGYYKVKLLVPTYKLKPKYYKDWIKTQLDL